MSRSPGTSVRRFLVWAVAAAVVVLLAIQLAPYGRTHESAGDW
jgi:hypothetical protein